MLWLGKEYAKQPALLNCSETQNWGVKIVSSKRMSGTENVSCKEGKTVKV